MYITYSHIPTAHAHIDMHTERERVGLSCHNYMYTHNYMSVLMGVGEG